MDYKVNRRQTLSEISEGAILGSLTALIYTMQLVFGIGTAVSYLSLVPLVYSGKKSFSEWIKVASVSSLFIFAFNDIGGAIFFLLFIIPLSLSIILRSRGEYLFVSSSVIFWSLVLILSKMSWIVGFHIPDFLASSWVLLTFIFSMFVVELLSRIISNILERFEYEPKEKLFPIKVIFLIVNFLIIFVTYSLTLQTLLIFAIMLAIFILEITNSAIRKEANIFFQKIFHYVHDLIGR